MILIVCIDERNGMLFNNRRQSRDKVLINHILEMTKDKTLWITGFSQDMFDVVDNKHIIIDNEFYEKADEEDFCFVEDIDVNTLIDKVDKIVIYNWNRYYPADLYFDISLDNWVVTFENEFIGSSHTRITEKIYVRWNR